MYFRCWVHSWTCGDCVDADGYWRLRAFRAGVSGKHGSYDPPKRCPNGCLWRMMWLVGFNSVENVLEF